MKYKRLLFVLFILLFPVIVLAENVSIKSVTLVEKSNFAEELNKPLFKDLTVDFDLRFQDVGDKVVYEVILSNKEKENYFLNLNVNSDSKYILYTLESEEDTNIIKGNKDTRIYIMIDYKNEVPDDLFINNKYNENNSIKLLLTNNKGEEIIVDGSSKKSIVVNPNTGNIILKIKNTNIVISLYTLLIVLIISIIAIIVLRKIKVKKYINLLLIMGLLIPGLAMAIKEVTIVINGKIEIEQVDLINFSIWREVSDSNEAVEFKYKAPRGMTWEEWKNSKYNVDNLDISFYERPFNPEVCIDGNYIDYISFEFHFAEDYAPGSSSNNNNNNNNTQEEPIFSDTPIESNGAYRIKEKVCNIKFTIVLGEEEIEYTAEPGMTWGEWLESEYNEENVHFEENKVNVSDMPCNSVVMYLLRIPDSYANIETYSDIIESRIYYLSGIKKFCQTPSPYPGSY